MMIPLPPMGHNWPFPSINGKQTPESIALQSLPVQKPLSQYEQVMSDPETQDSPL